MAKMKKKSTGKQMCAYGDEIENDPYTQWMQDQNGKMVPQGRMGPDETIMPLQPAGLKPLAGDATAKPDLAKPRDPNATGAKGKSNFPKMGVSLNTGPVIQALDALVTTQIYNPQIKAREAEIQRNLLNPVTSPLNFNGTEDMGIYADGGSTGYSYRSKKGSMSVQSDMPMDMDDNITSSMSMYKSSGRPTPQLAQPVPIPRVVTSIPKSVSYEKLMDRDGNVINYSPVFKGDFTKSEVKQFIRTMPKEFDGVPTINGFGEFKELWKMPAGTSSAQWEAPHDLTMLAKKKSATTRDVAGVYAKGGVAEELKVDPMLANAELEGGEFIHLPQGDTDMVYGKSHAEGGVDMALPEGTRIFSKRVKADKDFASLIMEKKVKKDVPIAKLANKFDTAKEDEILNNTNNDDIAKRTATMMKTYKQGKLDEIFEYQEATKEPGGAAAKFAKGGKLKRLGEGLVKGVGNAISGVGEFMPEAVGLINALTDVPIMSAKFQPAYMGQPQGLNVQDSLNKNYAQAKPFLESNSGNASVDSARALQALGTTLDANNQVMNQKFNADAQGRERVNQYNTQLQNQASLTNLDRLDKFWEKQTARSAVKEQSLNNIADSVYAKKKGMQMERRSLDLTNQMFPNYQYDPATGMYFNPTTGQYFHQPNGYYNGNSMNPNDNMETTYVKIVDKDGNEKFVQRNKEITKR